MNALDLVADLETRGVSLYPDGESLRWEGPLTVADRDRILAVKVEILALLAAPQGALPGPDVQSHPPDPDRSPGSILDGLDPRQIAAAEKLREWGAAGGPEHERREVTIELPAGGRVTVLPERTGAARCEVTWRELAADPLGTLTGVRTVLEAARQFSGRILPPMRPEQEAALNRPELPPHGGPACQRRELSWLDTVRGRANGAYCQGCGRWIRREDARG